MSKSRAVLNRIYLKLRPIYLAEHPICEACCVNPSTQIHHKKGRLGQLLIAAEFFMAVCLHCHDWIEKNKEAAAKKGWRLDRLGI